MGSLILSISQKGLSPIIMQEIFPKREIKFNLRSQTDFKHLELVLYIKVQNPYVV